MKTVFKNIPDNCTIIFTDFGITVRVSINISSELKKYSSPNLIFRGDKYWVYSIKKDIPAEYINISNVSKTYNYLLAKAMYNVRELKQQYLYDQMTELNSKVSNNKTEF